MFVPAVLLPYIDPVLVWVGPFTIRWYALGYIIGIVSGWFYGIWIARNPRFFLSSVHPQSKNPPEDIIIYITLGVILGGRFGYVFFYDHSLLIEDPLQILAIWNGGMSFHGGLIGLFLSLFLFCWRNKLPFLSLLDLTAVVTPIGLFVGRIGNFINAEILGAPSDVPWAVVFPGDGIARHPVQLYESFLEGLVPLFTLYFIMARYKALSWPGMLSGCFALLYSAARIFSEFFRLHDQYDPYLWGSLTTGILLTLPLILSGVILIVHALLRGPRLRWD